MANTRIKCKYCGQFVERDEAVSHPIRQKTYFCSNECMDKYDDSYNRPLTFIYRRFPNDPPNVATLRKQLDEFNKQGMNYEACYLTLVYMYSVLDNVPFDKHTGFTLIPAYYQEAKAHYEKINENKKLAQEIPEDKVVYMKPNNQLPLSLLKYRQSLKKGHN